MLLPTSLCDMRGGAVARLAIFVELPRRAGLTPGQTGCRSGASISKHRAQQNMIIWTKHKFFERLITILIRHLHSCCLQAGSTFERGPPGFPMLTRLRGALGCGGAAGQQSANKSIFPTVSYRSQITGSAGQTRAELQAES